MKIDETGSDLISNLKLQKLLYYAQGVYLAITGEKLFSDDILAWKHGPVVEAVYYTYKSNGSNGIDYDENFDFSKFDKKTENILEAVYDNFAQYSAWKLREMTHQETPWQNTPQSEVIDPNLIRDYFEENYVE